MLDLQKQELNNRLKAVYEHAEELNKLTTEYRCLSAQEAKVNQSTNERSADEQDMSAIDWIHGVLYIFNLYTVF